jgi:hypothetical protein
VYKSGTYLPHYTALPNWLACGNARGSYSECFRSNFVLGTDYPERDISRFSSVIPGKFRDSTPLGHDRFLQNPHSCIILLSMLYSLVSDSVTASHSRKPQYSGSVFLFTFPAISPRYHLLFIYTPTLIMRVEARKQKFYWQNVMPLSLADIYI